MSSIIITDDQEQNRYLLEALLKGNGHAVRAAPNGKEALQLARANPPELIISDILMPVMDGFTLCREWKNDDRLMSVPFIFFTATYTEPKDEAFGLSLGAQRYLVKPMEPEILLEIIDEVLAGRGAFLADDSTCGPVSEESVYLREYNEALIRKLESKMLQLEKTNRRLEREVMDRRQAETQLQRLFTAIESSAEIIIITDRSGGIEYVNPCFEKIIGYSRADALGRDARIILGNGKKTTNGIVESWNRVLSENAWEGHLSCKTSDSTAIELDATISPISESGGGISGFVWVMKDVTRQLHLENQLAQSQKMEAIGTLAGGIAHDFNNILGAIFGYTELSLLKIDDREKLRENLDAIHWACERARTLVEQILTFSRKTEQKKALMDLGPVIKESLKLVRASLPSTIEISANVESGAGMIMADPIQMHQVILNLCTNAGQAMQGVSGQIDIRLRRVVFDPDSVIPFPGIGPGSYMQFTISDTGCGMDKAILDRIFEPFYTTKKLGEGTGLGLSVAHGIITAHGGAITAYSEPGQGTTFNLYLPTTADGEMEGDVKDSGPLPMGSERILFIDDEKNLVDIGRQILEFLGYRVAATDSSRTALEWIRDDPGRYDLIITDQTMPGMTGRELAAEILKINPQMPIIICTGFNLQVEDKQAYEIGVRRLLLKPLMIREVARAVREVLDGS